MKYSDKLKDPRWQKKRLNILKRDKWECQKCGKKDISLQVHHKSYSYGREPWEYNNKNFVTLCENCHHIIEDMKLTSHPFNFDEVSIDRLSRADEYVYIASFPPDTLLIASIDSSKKWWLAPFAAETQNIFCKHLERLKGDKE